MSQRSELRRSIKKETRELLKDDRWNLVLGDLLVSAASGSSAAGVGVVLTGPFQYGLTNFSLKSVRKEERNTGDLFSGFSSMFGKSLGLFVLEFVYTLLWTLLFIIPGIIKSYSYSMAFYLLKDNPELGPDEAITRSRKLMKGHKWELFVLQLSFIGWILLSILTCGILAIFFVGPWMYLAQAKFYESIKENQETVEVIE